MREKNAEISARVDEMICLLHTNPNKMANALGYSRAQTIYDILNGKAAPSYDFFRRFLASGYAAFINLRWLISGEGSPIIEETYYQSDLPIIKGEMTQEQADQKLKEIKARKKTEAIGAEYSASAGISGRGSHHTENSVSSQTSNDLINHLETQLKEKDKEIGNLNKEVGRLEAQVDMLKEQLRESRVFSPITKAEEVSSPPVLQDR